MSIFSVRLSLAMALTAGLGACVADTTASTKAPMTASSVKTEGVYLATSDNGFNVPQVPVEKVPDEFERQVVAYETDQVPGTIVINPAQKHLFFVLGRGKAIRYGIAVGKAGFEWSGEANVTDRKNWPTWTPPAEMIDRKPELAKWEKGQPGGPTNPLGARALYLTTNGRDYGYRIHGTPDWWSIGKNASSGCIRMINQDVMDLYNRVPDGAKVIVLTRDGQMPKGLKLPPPAPKKKKPVEAEAAVATTAETSLTATPASTAAPTDGPMSVAGDTPVTGAETATPVAAPATPALKAPTADAGQSAATTPVGAEPSATAAPEPAPAVTPVAPACAVPLVDGVCPQN